jgi:hypothetical protein
MIRSHLKCATSLLLWVTSAAGQTAPIASKKTSPAPESSKPSRG